MRVKKNTPDRPLQGSTHQAIGLVQLDDSGKILSCNEGLVDVVGVCDEIVGTSISQLLTVASGDADWWGSVAAQLATGEAWSSRTRFVKNIASHVPIELTIVPNGGLDAVSGAWAIIRQPMSPSALGLVDLATRTAFLEEVQGHLSSRSRGVLLFIDVDRFRLIREGLGPAVSGALLVAVGERLRFAVGGTPAVIAHLGADEFAVFLTASSDPSLGEDVARRIHGALADALSLLGHEVFASVSIGIAATSSPVDAEQLLRDAEMAMIGAKKKTSGTYAFFEKGMRDRAAELVLLETDLRRAVEEGQFDVHYQPIMDLERRRVVGFEALVRWAHPEKGLLAPDRFIPMAEDTGLIVPMGHQVLKAACAQLHDWQQAYPSETPLTVSVNLSARQFADEDLLERVVGTLDATGLDPNSLKLEMTETAIMEHSERAEALLWELRNRQVQTYLDDFGTGYSSLSYLHRFPTDTLKIDRSFVANMAKGEGHLEIIQAILGLAGNLGMDVVAEGIETETQLEGLRALGCEVGQGYFFAKPLSTSDVAVFLTQEAGKV